MKLAVITDSTAVLSENLKSIEYLFVLDIPININGQSYVEGKNLSLDEFYEKMADSAELPKTSQPSLAELTDILERLVQENYTHVIGLFLSSGISGFWQNIQFLKDEFSQMAVAFPDTKITSAPLGKMVESVFDWEHQGDDFETILEKLTVQIEGTSAFIMVDDLNHLVKGGRLSNGSAILGNLLSIKPILYFDQDGKIVVYEKVRTEKKAIRRLVEVLEEKTANGDYALYIIHSRAKEKAQEFYELLTERENTKEISIVDFDGVIATHLGKGAVAFGFIPLV